MFGNSMQMIKLVSTSLELVLLRQKKSTFPEKQTLDTRSRSSVVEDCRIPRKSLA